MVKVLKIVENSVLVLVIIFFRGKQAKGKTGVELFGELVAAQMNKVIGEKK